MHKSGKGDGGGVGGGKGFQPAFLCSYCLFVLLLLLVVEGKSAEGSKQPVSVFKVRR